LLPLFSLERASLKLQRIMEQLFLPEDQEESIASTEGSEEEFRGGAITTA